MAPVGRPRSRTDSGASPPVNELGIPDMHYGSPGYSIAGFDMPWSRFIDQHEFVPELVWPNSVRTFDQMRTDSQLAALYTAVAYGISQLRFIIDPNGAKPAIISGISEDLNLPIRGKDDEPRRRMKHRFSHHKHVGQALLSLIYGHMFFEQIGQIVDGKWRLRKLAPRMPHSIQNINVADDGGLVSIQQWTTKRNPGLSPPEIPVDRLTAFVFAQEGANWVGRSMFRDCYKDWLIKDRLVRIDAINHERAGGVPYLEGAPGMTPGEIADLDEMAREFRIGESAGGAVPSGTKLNIARGTGSDVDKSIHSRDEAMARRFLLQLMNLAQSGQHVGSYSLGETFEDFFIVGQRAIVQWYADVMTEHVIEDWVDWNYGEDEDLTPVLTWERTSEDALGVEQLATLVQRGVIAVDDELENAIRYKYRLPKRTAPRPEVTPGGPRQPTEQQAQSPTDGQSDQGVGPGQGAPSPPPTPAPVRASLKPYDWERDPEHGTPDVMAAGPALVTVPNVPVLEAGVDYDVSTGVVSFTPEELADAVCAANEDPSIPTPRLKLGHIDPRFNDKQYDATPSFGSARNLRLSDNGMVVYADYVGVPKWLAEILPTAFPSRSVEGFWDIKSQASGREWKFVLSACSLLGVQWPGIRQLEDLPNYYGEERPADVLVHASQPGGDPMKLFRRTHASLPLDDVRRAFYNNYVHENQEARWWWIRSVLTDPNQLVVEDDETGKLFMLSFESGDKGDVRFGELEQVEIDYVPLSARKEAAPHVAAALVTGRKVLASYESRAASSPEEGGGMDPKAIRQRLNLPEDATDEQVQEQLKELNEAVGTSAAAATPSNASQGGATAVGTGTAEEHAQAAAVGAASPDKPITPSVGTTQPNGDPDKAGSQSQGGTGLPTTEGPVQAAHTDGDGNVSVVTLDPEQYKALREGAEAGLTLKKTHDANERESLVAAAIGDGRIPPARREHWLKALEADAEGNGAVLASLAPGLIPLEERGSNETGETQAAIGQDAVGAFTSNLFPEVQSRKAMEAQMREGGRPPQIMREEGS